MLYFKNNMFKKIKIRIKWKNIFICFLLFIKVGSTFLIVFLIRIFLIIRKYFFLGVIFFRVLIINLLEKKLLIWLYLYCNKIVI